MTPLALAFLLLFWGIILALTGFSLYHIFRDPWNNKGL